MQQKHMTMELAYTNELHRLERTIAKTKEPEKLSEVAKRSLGLRNPIDLAVIKAVL